MGTSIADLLGAQLPEEWRQIDGSESADIETVEPTRDSAEETTAVSVSDQVGQQQMATPREVVVAAVLEETEIEPTDMKLDLLLDEDLGLTGIALWAVVAQIESELDIQFVDVEVHRWETLGDLLSAVSQQEGAN